MEEVGMTWYFYYIFDFCRAICWYTPKKVMFSNSSKQWMIESMSSQHLPRRKSPGYHVSLDNLTLAHIKHFDWQRWNNSRSIRWKFYRDHLEILSRDYSKPHILLRAFWRISTIWISKTDFICKFNVNTYQPSNRLRARWLEKNSCVPFQQSLSIGNTLLYRDVSRLKTWI